MSLIRFTDTTNNDNTGGFSAFVGAKRSGIAGTSNQDLVFGTGNNAINMVLTGAGKVGIGITSPTEQLHVDGNIKATGGISTDNNELMAFDKLERTLQSGETNSYTFSWDKATNIKDVSLKIMLTDVSYTPDRTYTVNDGMAGTQYDFQAYYDGTSIIVDMSSSGATTPSIGDILNVWVTYIK